MAMLQSVLLQLLAQLLAADVNCELNSVDRSPQYLLSDGR